MTDKAKTQTAEAKAQDDDRTLSAEESKALRNCEASIRNGLKSFYNVGRALTVIQQDRLYRQEFSTFKAYARARWDMTPARVSQLTGAYRIHEYLKEQGFLTLPATESQCRPFARIPLDEAFDSSVLAVWTAVIEACKAGDKLTAKLVNDQVDAVLGIDKKADNGAEGGDSAGMGAAGEANTSGQSTGESASAAQRAEVRELKQRVAYLESQLEAEKKAHQRTAQGKGLPKSAMAKELFKAGFRKLAAKYHPDHGGSADTMRDLNNLKDALGI